jgi:diacylglycerol kinase (ATP)
MNPISFFIRLFKATGYSLAGLKAAVDSEAAFLQEIIMCLVLIPAACMLPIPLVSKALLISSLLLILIIELINTALETVVNRISEEQHPLSKKAKDIGSAAVMLSLVNAAVVWFMVLWPEFSLLF